MCSTLLLDVVYVIVLVEGINILPKVKFHISSLIIEFSLAFITLHSFKQEKLPVQDLLTIRRSCTVTND